MAGIAGWVTYRASKPIIEYLQGLLQSLKQNKDDIVKIYTNQFCGLGSVSHQDAVNFSISMKNNVILSWTGYIAQESSPAQQSPVISNNHPPQILSDHLLDQYLQYGTSALRGLNGQYVIVLWDGNQEKLNIINDRYGLQPFYYWQSRQMIVFASSIKAIAHHPDFSGQIDPAALFNLLAAGQMLGEQTLFQEIKALPPATELSYADGYLTLSRYWDPPLYQPGERTLPIAAARDQYSALIQTAVERHTSATDCLLLTGGLDSRWLAGAMVAKHGSAQLQSNTIGHPLAKDARLAQKIAAAIGLRHQVIPVNSHYLSEYANETILRTEGNMNITAGWILGETGYIHENGINQIVTGIGAELISSRHWLSEQPQLNDQRRFDPAYVAQYISTNHWQFNRAAALMSQPYRAETQAANIDLIKQCLIAAPSEDVLSRYDYFHLTQHRRYPTGNILSADANVREPFFDNDLVDFAFSIPPQSRSYLYRKALASSFPELANIETTEGGLSIVSNLSARNNRLPQVEKIIYRAIRKLRLTGVAKLPNGDTPWNTIYPNHWMRTTSKAYVANFIKCLDQLEPWIDRPAAQQMIEDHIAGRVDAYSIIGGLLTAVLWMEQIR